TRPAWEIEPAIEMGNYPLAEKWIYEAGHDYPLDPEVNLWKAALRCKLARWPEALAEASTALAKAKPNSNVALQTVTARAYFYKCGALLYPNKLRDAKVALDNALALDN